MAAGMSLLRQAAADDAGSRRAGMPDLTMRSEERPLYCLETSVKSGKKSSGASPSSLTRHVLLVLLVLLCPARLAPNPMPERPLQLPMPRSRRESCDIPKQETIILSHARQPFESMIHEQLPRQRSTVPSSPPHSELPPSKRKEATSNRLSRRLGWSVRLPAA